jgi:hypothetical protein
MYSTDADALPYALRVASEIETASRAIHVVSPA